MTHLKAINKSKQIIYDIRIVVLSLLGIGACILDLQFSVEYSPLTTLSSIFHILEQADCVKIPHLPNFKNIAC